ncbi:MAG: nickel-binding protein [Gaiellaceae bacterium]
MTLYVIRRPSGWADSEQLGVAAQRSRRIGDDEMSADIRWIRSFVVRETDGSLGTVCIYEATSPEKIREHADRADLPATDILEVVDTVVVRPDPR